MPRVFAILYRTLSVGILTLAFGSESAAQFVNRPSSNAAPTGVYARGLAGSGQGNNITNFSVNSGGYGYGGGGYGGNIATPWSTNNGGWIQPATAYYIQNDIASQQAFLQGRMSYQDIELRRLQLKRAAFDEMAYEKMNTPPPEVLREERRLNRLARARNTPPLNEITSGAALNELLNNIQRIQSNQGVTGATIPLDAETVNRINVTTTGDNRGSNVFFKPGSAPDWPFAFSDPIFDEDKKRIAEDVKEMVQAQRMGKIDNARAADAKRTAALIKDKLYGIRFQVQFNDNIAALEFLAKLNDGVDLLSKPGGKNFLDGTNSAKGNTVAELVDYMISKGLKFAQATPGLESYYSTLYQDLVTYEIGLSRKVGQQSTLQTAQQK